MELNNNEVASRLDNLIVLAQQEYDIVCALAADVNSTETISNSIESLELKLKKLNTLIATKTILLAETDPTQEEVEGHVVETRSCIRVLGLLSVNRHTSPKWLHIGSPNELKPTISNNGPQIEHLVIEELKGTRSEVMRVFLQKYYPLNDIHRNEYMKITLNKN